MKYDLTDKTIKRLPTPPLSAGSRDFPDISVKQLVLTIRPTGSCSWTLRYRFGKGEERTQRRLTIGTWPDMKVEEARERAIAARKLLASGIDPVAHDTEQRKSEEERQRLLAERAFARLAESFALSQRRDGRRSWAEQARILGLRATEQGAFSVIRGGLVERWHSTPLAAIERLDVKAAIDELLNRDCPEAARTRLAVLKSFFSWAFNEGYVGSSPIKDYRLKSPKVSRDRVLSDDEIRLFWRATSAEGYPFREYLRLLLLVPQRRCEVAGMRFDEIAGDVWTLPASRSKNKRPHRIPLSAQALELIRSVPRFHSGDVFTCRGRGPLNCFSELKARIDARMADLAGPGVVIPQWGFHDLRRTIASGMASLGIPPHVAELSLTHTSGTISGVAAIYNRYDYLAEKRDALQRWADHLMRIVGSEAEPIETPSNVVALQIV